MTELYGVWGYKVQKRDDGTYTWMTGELSWEWFDANRINLSRVMANGQKEPVMHFKDLTDAMLFTLGFASGFTLAAMVGETGDGPRKRTGPRGA